MKIVFYGIPEEEVRRLAGRMARYGASVDAVVVSCADDFSAVHYCSQPGRFFSVSGEAGEEALEYELTRIVETRLGLVCAHEGVEP